MTESFEQRDLSGAEFWAVDLRGATFRDVNLSGVSISHALLAGVTIDGLVDRLVVNGVDVTAFVNEHDPWYPLRAMVRPGDPEAALAAWDALDRAWSETVSQARALPDEARHASVGGEWSFVQTLRHLVFGADKWYVLPLLGDAAMDPIGLPNTGSIDEPWPGVVRAADPSFDEAVAARAAQVARIRDHLRTLTAGDLERGVDVLENGSVTVLDCIHTVLEESFEHLRYARRDLAALS